MRIGRIAVLSVLVCGLLISLSGVSGASTVSYNAVTSVSDTTTDWVRNIVFPQFDSSLGTLTQVDLYITSTINTTLTIINNDPSGSEGNAKTHLIVTVTDPATLLSVISSIYSQPFDYVLGGGGSISSGLLTDSGSNSGSWTTPAILAEFTGTGNISLNASTFTETVLANTGGNTAAAQVTTASATGTVTYHYNVVPEPGSFAVMGSALFGLLAFARRRK
jgi:hypothetical protein